MFKKVISKIFIIFITIYIMCLFIAVPYFNWRYAKENGFISWLFFGEIVATFKAVIFPYYIYTDYLVVKEDSSFPPFPSVYIDDRNKFTKVNELFSDFTELTSIENSKNSEWWGGYTIPKEQEDLAFSKLNEGINLSKSIKDDFFNYLHPEFKDNFRNKFIKGHEIILNQKIQKTESEKIRMQLEGIKLIEDYYEWWDKNKDQIIDKAFSK